jgi:hypothetical protein
MRKIITLLFLIAIVAAAGVGYYFGYDHGFERAGNQNEAGGKTAVPNNNQDQSKNAAETVFHKSPDYGFYGTLTLTGYLDVRTRVCNPGDMCGETVEYASFVFTKTSSEAIREFTGEFQGNSFIAGDRVGLGCFQETAGRIYYQNYGDENKIEGEIKGEDFAKLAQSNKNRQVELKLTRPIYTSGQGAPDCYSHFRNFDVL